MWPTIGSIVFTHVLWYGGYVKSKTNAGMKSDSDALWFRAYLFFFYPVFSLPLLLPLLLYFLVRLSIGYDDLMSSCKFSSPDDCVKFVFGSSVGVLVSFSSYLFTT
ncbi:hypothetical protein HKD37_08G021557 [Glycine soja]